MPRTRGTFVKGGPIPKSPGRPPTPKLSGYDFKADAARLLPLAMKRIERLLRTRDTESALIVRIAENLADRVHGRPSQSITGANGGPLLLSFTQIVQGVDGAKAEKL